MAKLELEPKLIRALAEAMGDTGLAEIEFADGGKRIRLARAVAAPAPAASVAAPAPTVAVAPPPAAAAPAPSPAAAEPDAPAGDDVPSPMVGTVYLSPSPDAAAFVKPGDKVEKGQTLLIVEAMKVMNPIAAPRAGVISAVFVRDKQPVEFGEPLMRIA